MAKPKRPTKHAGGRPANPLATRVNVLLDPDLKRRVIILGANDGVSFHKVLDAALRKYLDARGVK